MSYGRLSERQAAAIKRHIEGRTVHDLGAGQCELSLELARLGAERVFAVDEEPMPPVAHPAVVQVRSAFVDLPADLRPDVAFVSAPASHPMPGLLRLLADAKTVVYLGKNTDATACGWPGMFRLLAGREILEYVPERRNTLIVYGGRLAGPRPLRGEEFAGLTMKTQARPLRFDEAESRGAWPAP